MAYFDSDGGGGKAVDPVYLKCEGSDLLQIYPLSYHSSYTNSLIGSPSELGVEQLDNKVVNPAKVDFTGIVKYPQRRVFMKLRKNMLKIKLQNLKCVFYSKAGYISNMLIEKLEEIGDNKRYDGIEIRVSLHEYLEHSVSN